jgi:ABC-2 type transport system permease protein
MINLIKMEFYRLFRTKAVKIGAICAAVVSFLFVLFNFGLLEIVKHLMELEPDAVYGIGVFFSVVSWLEGVDFAEVVLKGTGALSLFLSCVIAASYIGAEQSSGYVKNIAGQLPNRGLLIVSRFVATCFIQFMVLSIYTVVSSLGAVTFFVRYLNACSFGTLLLGLLLRFLLFCAVDAALLFFCTLTKSHAIAMIIGAIFGTGATNIVYSTASLLLDIIRIPVDVAMLMPDGINGLINASSVKEIDIVIRAIVVSLVFIFGFVFSAAMIIKKRDVR